eukprot:scpid30925/ scgid5087/ Ankyrin repeat and SOCS box protein 8
MHSGRISSPSSTWKKTNTLLRTSTSTCHCWDMALRSGYDRVVKIFAQYCRSGEAYDMDGLIRTHAFQDDAFQQVVEWKDDSVSEVHEMSFGAMLLLVLMKCGQQLTDSQITECSKLVLSYGEVDLNELDRTGFDRTLLHYAARVSSHAVAKVLVQHGANVNAKDKNEFTPIHTAAYKGNVRVLRALLSCADADLEARTYDKETALELAMEERFSECVDLLEAVAGMCEEEEASIATARMDANEGGVVSDGSTRLAVQPGALPMDLSVSVVQHFSRAKHGSEGSPSESGDLSRLKILSVVSCTPSGLRPKQSVQLEVNVAGEQGVAGDVPDKHELRVICTPGQLSRSSIASPPQVEDITDNCNIDADADTGIATMNITYFADISILRMNPTTGNLSVANGNGDGSGGGGASMGCLTDADRCQVSDFISSSISSTVVVKVFFRWFHATMGELSIGFGGTEDQFGAFNAADEVKSFRMKPLKLTSSDSFQVKVLVRDDDWMIPEDQLQSCEDQICSLEAEEISLEVVRRDNLSDSTTSDKPVVIRLELIVDSRTGKRSHARSFNLPPPPLPQRKGQRLSQAASGPWADERFPAEFYCGWIKLIDERILRDISVECELLKGDIINDLVAATGTPSVHIQLYLDHITPLGEDTFDKFLAVVEKVYKHKVSDFEELREPGSMADLKEKRENPWCDERFFSHDLRQWILELNPQRLRNEARRKRMWCRKYETGLYELRHTQQLHNEKFIRYMAPGEHVTFEKFLEIVKVFNKDKVEKFRELLSEAKTQRTRGVVRKTVVDPASPLVGSVVPDERPATVTSTPSCEPTVIPPPRSESPCIRPSQPPAGDHTQEPPTSPTRQPLGEARSGKFGPASSPRPTKFEDYGYLDDDSSMSSCCCCC